jgi:tryptophan halogenase
MGNAAGFVEPLEATAIGATCDAVSLLVRAMQASDNHVIPIQRDIYNRVVWQGWEMIRNFLAVHYKFNTRLDTPFWRAARSDTQLGQAAELVEYYQAVGPDFRLLNFDLKRDFFSTEGYFAMLVGQGVPYRRHVEIGERERQQWDAHKRALAAEAATGMAMTECLASLRKYGLPESPAWGFTNADMVQPEIGDLQWQSPV